MVRLAPAHVENRSFVRQNATIPACSMVVQDSTAGMFSNMMGVLRALSEYSYVHVQWTQVMYQRDNNTWNQYFLPIAMFNPAVSPRACWQGANIRFRRRCIWAKINHKQSIFSRHALSFACDFIKKIGPLKTAYH